MTTTSAQTFTAYQITGRTTRRTVAVGLNDADVIRMVEDRTDLILKLDGNEPPACAICDNGCACETGIPRCGHYGCWGSTQGAADECSEYGAAKARVRTRLHNGNIERRIHNS
jgi:hypothetical protein